MPDKRTLGLDFLIELKYGSAVKECEDGGYHHFQGEKKCTARERTHDQGRTYFRVKSK